MLRRIAEYCTQMLINHGLIQVIEKAIYIYGFELFWSTFSCSFFIVVLGSITGNLNQSLTFLLCFLPIRTFAGGYHAKSFKNCFWLSNFIALGCIYLSTLYWMLPVAKVSVLILFVTSLIYIWIKAPVTFKNHPIKLERIKKNKKYAQRVIIIEALIFIYLYLANYKIIYMIAVTSFTVAFMMYIAIREEEEV